VTAEAATPPRNNRRTLLIVVGAVLVLCCAGGVVGGFALYHGVGQTTGPAKDATDGFLRDIEAARYVSAYDRLCGRAKAAATEAQFEASERLKAPIRSHKITGIEVSTVNGEQTALVTAALTEGTGSVATHVIPVIVDGGVWRVCGEPY
jgi:hypothetical protein